MVRAIVHVPFVCFHAALPPIILTLYLCAYVSWSLSRFVLLLQTYLLHNLHGKRLDN